jgi:Flp pilus assembly pilin Flp
LSEGVVVKKINRRKGQGLVEYSLIIALVALVCIVAMVNISSTIQDSFYQNISGEIQKVSDKM